MILDYYGIEKSEDELCEELDHTYEYGCTNESMVDYFNRNGFKSELKTFCTIDDLRKEIDEGRPVIVDWFSTNCGHASIVVEVTKNYVIFYDPEEDKFVAMPYHEFMTVWFDWKNSPYISTWEDMVIRGMITIRR
jgi:predicted double-glycine peptidase